MLTREQLERIHTTIENNLSEYTKTFPVDLQSIAKKLDISIIPVSREQKFSGSIKKDNISYEIRVNTNHSWARQRFTVAHEIAHYFLHRGDIDSRKDEIRDYSDPLLEVGREAENSLDKIKEQEANEFSAQLLMPEELMLKELEKAASVLNDISWDFITELLSEKFEVSKPAVAIRLNNILTNNK